MISLIEYILWIKLNLKPKVKGDLEENQRALKKMTEDTLSKHNHKGVIQRLVDTAIREGSKKRTTSPSSRQEFTHLFVYHNLTLRNYTKKSSTCQGLALSLLIPSEIIPKSNPTASIGYDLWANSKKPEYQ